MIIPSRSGELQGEQLKASKSTPLTPREGTTTTEDMLIETAERFCVLRERRLHGDVQGLYLRESNLILLDCDLTSEQRCCVLAHEISHARHLDEGCRMDRWSERRADQEAAKMLIDPLEYAYAEAVYEGNVMGMARELNVLPWVIEAYRERLHDDPHLVLQ